MIRLEEALRVVVSHTRKLDTEIRPLDDVAGAVLAERVTARRHFPPFDASAVDGYAVRRLDLAGVSPARKIALRVQAVQRAGDRKRRSLIKGSALRIFTGAMIPLKADAVIMQEKAERAGSSVTFSNMPLADENIRRTGAEFSRGEKMLAPGTVVTPPVVGLLAAAGRSTVRVYRRPRVALLVTGDELRDAGSRLRPGEVADSNTPALVSALSQLGIDIVQTARVNDSKRALGSALRRSIAGADVVVAVGGVSVGDYDLVRVALETLGVTTRFWKVAIKPGKPLYFGTRGRTLVFGLPGNPVAALVTFHLFVAPAIRRMMGYGEKRLPATRARLTVTLRKRTGRHELVRGILARTGEGTPTVRPTRGQESHMLGGLSSANCLVHFPARRHLLRRGALVRVTPLIWSAPT